MTAIADSVVDWVRGHTRSRGTITAATTLDSDLGVTGDELSDLLEAYSKRFSVDMIGYLWYFHKGDEGWPGPGALFFKPPNRRVPHIPITIEMLVEFADTGAWAVSYPPHQVPSRRIDLLINRIFVVVAVAAVVVLLLWKYNR